MGSIDYQMVKALKPYRNFLVNLMAKHKFYQEVYVKNGGKSYYKFFMYKPPHIVNSTVKIFLEILEKEIILLNEVNFINNEEADTLRNMILHTEDEDNILIGMLLLKKHRKVLDKKLKDPIFEAEFITNIACDYYYKIHKPYMDTQLRLNKK